VKPHLLSGVVNNLGAQTSIWYAPSTRHYLTAALTHEPWLTRLPFPVPVVDRVEITDHVSGTHLTSQHRYWHGHFDGIEREFRGFILTETVDAESVPGPAGPPPDDDLDLPPVRTRSWFHSGVFPDVSGGLAAGYWSGDALAEPLPPHDIVSSATGREVREAHRALAGMPLRTEVYSDDGTPEAVSPHAVAMHRHRVVRLQPVSENRPAVFRSHPLETVTYHYERNPADREWRMS
jgi:hypothetical protein